MQSHSLWQNLLSALWAGSHAKKCFWLCSAKVVVEGVLPVIMENRKIVTLFFIDFSSNHGKGWVICVLFIIIIQFTAVSDFTTTRPNFMWGYLISKLLMELIFFLIKSVAFKINGNIKINYDLPDLYLAKSWWSNNTIFITSSVFSVSEGLGMYVRGKQHLPSTHESLISIPSFRRKKNSLYLKCAMITLLTTWPVESLYICLC